MLNELRAMELEGTIRSLWLGPSDGSFRPPEVTITPAEYLSAFRPPQDGELPESGLWFERIEAQPDDGLRAWQIEDDLDQRILTIDARDLETAQRELERYAQQHKLTLGTVVAEAREVEPSARWLVRLACRYRR